MQNVRQATEGDSEKWDKYVLSHPNSTAYHLWAWKTSIELAYGHKASYFLEEQNEDIRGVFPLVKIALPLLLNEFTALPFCDVGNCLADSAVIQKHLLEKGITYADAEGCNKLNLRGSLLDAGIDSRIFLEETKKVRMILSLPESSEALLKSFKSKLRSQIKKAEKNGVKFSWADIEGVEAFYDVYSRNMRDLGSPPHSKKWFRSIMENYGEKAKIGLAEYEGKFIGAGLILSTNQQTSIPWASTLREFNRFSPNMLLYWNFLKYSADNYQKIFDFGRSTEGKGTYKFKKQWGAKAEKLLWYSLHCESGQNKKTSGKRDNMARVWAKLPVAVSNGIGPWLRRYISL